MAALVSIISAISGICSIVKFGESQFAMATADDTKLQIEVGLDYSGGLSGAGGDLPDVRLWNEAGDFVGISADPGNVDDGTQGEISVGSDGQQATYVLFSANDDAICVAYVSMTWPDKSKYGWEGSWGKECGGTWYYSNIYINNGNYKPPCLWIDANGDQPQTGFSLHFPEFVSKNGKAPSNKNTTYFCDNSPVFSLRTEEDPSTIDFWVLGNSRLMSRSESAPTLDARDASFNRQNVPTVGTGSHSKHGKDKHLNKHIISDDAVNHSAVSLCESRSSVGPDFTNLAEGLHCRMSDHTLFPICDKTITDNCFNTDSESVIVGGKATRDTPYEWSQDWTSKSKSRSKSS